MEPGVVVYNYMDTFFCCMVEKDKWCEEMISEHMLVYLCSGKMELIAPEKKYHLKKSDAFFVKRNHLVRKIKQPSKSGVLTAYEFERKTVGDNDVLIEILYSGICHSDIHQSRDEWGGSIFPMVPGHEIAGRVIEVGKNVTKFKVGDLAGVGCMVNSCGVCDRCKAGEEQYCENNKTVYTYNSRDFEGDPTLGGYSNNIVVTEKFALKIPQGADLARIAPLLCAGTTTYSPLRFTHVGQGDKIAVAGFGGLGHLAVQYAVSFGAEVTVFDISEDKRTDAIRMGATKYVNVNNPEEWKGLENSFRVILSTIPAKFNVEQYVRMLKVDGEMVLICSFSSLFAFCV